MVRVSEGETGTTTGCCSAVDASSCCWIWVSSSTALTTILSLGFLHTRCFEEARVKIEVGIRGEWKWRFRNAREGEGEGSGREEEIGRRDENEDIVSMVNQNQCEGFWWIGRNWKAKIFVLVNREEKRKIEICLDLQFCLSLSTFHEIVVYCIQSRETMRDVKLHFCY